MNRVLPNLHPERRPLGFGWLVPCVILSVACHAPGSRPPPETGASEPPPRVSPGKSRSPGHVEVSELDPAAPRPFPAPTPVDDLAAALNAATHGNPGGARVFLEPYVQAHPEDHDARGALIGALRELGESEAAQAIASASPPSWPAVTAAITHALLWEDRGDVEAAIAVLEAALQREPDTHSLKGELVRLRHLVGRTAEPTTQELINQLYDAYDAGEATSAEQLLAVAQAALARGTKGAFKDANMVLGDAETLAPNDGSQLGDRIRLIRARMFAEKYAADDALATLDVLLERNSWHPDALAMAAGVKADTLQFAHASRLAQEALAVNPRHASAHGVLAKIALVEGRRDEAKQRVEAFVQHGPARGTSGPAVMAALALMNADTPMYEQWQAAALAWNPRNGAFFSELSELLAFLHLYPEIEDTLREATTIAPSDPYVRAARGLNLLRLGQETLALEELGLAWKRDPFNERTGNVLDLYEKAIVADYVTTALGDVTVRLPNEDADFIRPVLADSLAWSRADLDRAYALTTSGLRLEFFKNAEEFSIRTVGVPSLGAVAVCFGPVVTFIGPYHGLHNIENVIRHELAHVYAIRHSRGRVPRWFTEGLSEWESELADPAWARESAQLLQQARKMGKLRRLGELELAFIRAESGAMMEVAYATAAYAVRYLGQTYGRPALVTMLRGYGEGKTTEVLTQEVLGREFSAIEREFEQWFFAQLDAKVRGWHPSADPKRADKRDALFRRAATQVEARDFAAAKTTLEALIARGGDGFAPRIRLAQLLARTASPKAAEAHLHAARAFAPEAIEPWVELANLARRESRIDDEKKYLQAALAIDGEAFEPAARLVLLAEVTHDKDAAASARRRARAIAPLHPLSLAAQALALLDERDRDGAEAHLERGLSSLKTESKGPADTWAMAAFAAAGLGRTQDAGRMAKVAIERGGLPKAVVKALDALRTRDPT